MRVDTQTILTIHNNVITRNPRISLSRPGENKWYLHLNAVQESDRGWYMCQVTLVTLFVTIFDIRDNVRDMVRDTIRDQINTDPMVHRSGYVQVVVPPSIVQSGQSHDMVVR